MLLGVWRTIIEISGRAAAVRYSHYCSRECMMVMVEFEEFTTLKFILINSRWSGGVGFRTLEEKMQEAVEQLPIDEGVLALL
jgi:hypothetical protein